MNRFSEKTTAWRAPVFFALARGREGFVWLGNVRRRSLLSADGQVHQPLGIGRLFELLQCPVNAVPPQLWPDTPRILNPLRVAHGSYPGNLPAVFALNFAPLLDGQQEQRRWLGLYWGLGLHFNEGLAASTHRLLLRYGPAPAYAWLAPLLGLAPEVRDPLAALLAELEIPLVNVRKYDINDPQDFYDALNGFHNMQGGVSDGADYVDLLYAFVHGVALGLGYDHLLDTARLYRRLNVPMNPRMLAPCRDYAPGPAGLMIELLGSRFSNYQIRKFWNDLSELPGYVAVCREWLRWEFAAENIGDLLRFMEEFAPAYRRDVMWPVVRERLPGLMRCLGSLHDADERETQLTLLGNFARCCTEPAQLQELWPRFLSLAAKMREHKVIDYSYASTELLFEFARLADENLFTQCLAAPRSSFRRLEDAARSDNRRNFVDHGLQSLRKMLPGFLTASFRDFPAKLFRSAELLGSLSTAEAMRAVGDFRQAGGLALVQRDEASPAAILSLVENILAREPGLYHPVPERLRRYLAGETDLPAVRLRHSVDAMQRDRILTGLELLERCIRRRLFAKHREPDNADLHTFQMIVSLPKENRRPLKKFLRAYHHGEHEYLERHPRNAVWIRERRKLDTRAWFDGFAVRSVVPGRSLSLAPERNPHEILKMGTYVGSCTGLGGLHQYNAAVTLLDANKLLIYARDAGGGFVARQVLAVTDDERLACFEVYPSVDANVLAAFREYDRRFAARIGLDIVDDYNYTVSVLIGNQWYDDGIWEWYATE